MIDERIVLNELEKFLENNKSRLTSETKCNLYLDTLDIVYKAVFPGLDLTWSSSDYLERKYFKVIHTDVKGLVSFIIDIKQLVYSWFR